jgi:hypothetical protein
LFRAVERLVGTGQKRIERLLVAREAGDTGADRQGDGVRFVHDRLGGENPAVPLDNAMGLYSGEQNA